MGLYKKYRLKTISTKANLHLVSLKVKHKTLDLLIKDLPKYRDIITDEEYKQMEQKQLDQNEYLRKGNPFAIDLKTLSYYEKEKEWIQETKQYHEILKKYTELNDSFNSKLHLLGEEKERVNRENKKYMDRVGHFIEDVSIAKQDYFTASMKKRFEANYLEAYSYLMTERNRRMCESVSFSRYSRNSAIKYPTGTRNT